MHTYIHAKTDESNLPSSSMVNMFGRQTTVRRRVVKFYGCMVCAGLQAGHR